MLRIEYPIGGRKFSVPYSAEMRRAIEEGDMTGFVSSVVSLPVQIVKSTGELQSQVSIKYPGKWVKHPDKPGQCLPLYKHPEGEPCPAPRIKGRIPKDMLVSELTSAFEAEGIPLPSALLDVTEGEKPAVASPMPSAIEKRVKGEKPVANGKA